MHRESMRMRELGGQEVEEAGRTENIEGLEGAADCRTSLLAASPLAVVSTS